MAYRPAPHIHVAFPSPRAIILDTRTDRYHRAGRRQSDCLRHLAAGTSIPASGHEALRTMLAAGQLVEGPSGKAWPLPGSNPLRRAPVGSEPGRGSRASDIVALARALATLRLSGLDATLRAARHRAMRPRTPDPGRAAVIADGLRHARRWFPFQTRCLVNSLAQHQLLCTNDIACRLVIGVRDGPFAAHCWVEADNLLLNDDLDTVGELTPILAL